jgi:uncharacterized protein (TIGR03437 family)
VWKDYGRISSKIASPEFSTKQSNELLLALIAADSSSSTNTSVTGVTGAGLTWELVVRTRTQKGTAEIWRTFAPSQLSGVSVSAVLSRSVTSSMTVMSFTGVEPSGANGSGAIGAIGTGNNASGAPTASLVTTRDHSLVVGVGADPQRALSRVPADTQSLVHQYLAVGYGTYWVQSQMSTATPAGTSVTLSDSSPTQDPYNFSLCEILGAAVAAGSAPVMSVTSMLPVAPTATAGAANTSAPAAASSFTLASPATGTQGKTCSPGGLVTLSGTGFTGQSPQSATTYPLPTKLAGVAVKVNGSPVPLLFTSASQINFQCPLLPQGADLEIAVAAESGGALPPVHSTMLAAAPDLFTLNGTTQGVILIASTNELAMTKTAGAASRPAQPGEPLTIYASGLGETQRLVTPGALAPSNPLVLLKNKITVVAGGVEIDPDLSTLAPGTVGLYQINTQLPPGVPLGPAVPLFIRVTMPNGAVAESNTVTLAIEDSSVN